MKTDIEIARETKLKRVVEVAQDIQITEDNVESYGKYMAKIPINLIDESAVQKSNLILVTAITPTKAGIGKTVTSIGLAMGLNSIGKRAVVAIREPSLGPCFGMKGGAAGGGYSQVLPMEKINLHFTGDFHAVTSAHNMISALLDNHIYRHQSSQDGLKEVLWKRVLDINDRNLRFIITGLNGRINGVPAESGFDITPASELMAILCLSNNQQDLRDRIERILLGYTHNGQPFTVKDLGIAGAITVLLKDALNPNLVQTTEQSAAFIHGGPFGNIAHGCNSIVATKMAMSHSDYVVTEAGFGSDLGAEKFYNIKCRKSGLQPKVTVIVATTQALKMHGGVAADQIAASNPKGVEMGLANLKRHLEIVRSFGQTPVVAINRYNSDTKEELKIITEFCEKMSVPVALNDVWAKGGAGAKELAECVVKTIKTLPSAPIKFTYEDEDSIVEKIEKVAKTIYKAKNVIFTDSAKKILKRISGEKLEKLPICIAKTQYSFSADPTAYGAVKDFTLEISNIVINQGAGFIVAVAGKIMRMPGLPSDPQAKRIDIVDGEIFGLS